MPKKIDLLNQRFGRLVVKEFAGIRRKRRFWKCVCDCGGVRTTETGQLRGGICQSCGCIRAETNRERCLKHGKCKTPEYRTWCSMITRCYNPNRPKYRMHGGRGIIVCDRWRTSFENFLADMGPRPSPTHSIDRIDNDGNYEPGNCRWATPKQQSRNQRTTIFITHNGETLPQREWMERTGLSRSTIDYRRKAGKSPAEILS